MANFKAMGPGPTLGAMAHVVITGYEAASQTYKRGAVVIFSSGKVAIGAADPTLGTVIGIADAPASGTTNKEVPILPAIPGLIYEGTLDVAAGTYVLAYADFGAKYGLGLDSTSGHFFIDQAETTAEMVAIVGFKDPVGTTSGRVYFTFLAAVSSLGAVAS